MFGSKGLMFNFDIFLSLVIIIALFSYTLYLPQTETASMSHINLAVREQNAFYTATIVRDSVSADTNYICREFYVYSSNTRRINDSKVCEVII